MAYFGFPEAHENDAERAARAGLPIIEAVSGLNPHGGPKLSERVGIDSGAVVGVAPICVNYQSLSLSLGAVGMGGFRARRDWTVRFSSLQWPP